MSWLIIALQDAVYGGAVGMLEAKRSRSEDATCVPTRSTPSNGQRSWRRA